MCLTLSNTLTYNDHYEDDFGIELAIALFGIKLKEGLYNFDVQQKNKYLFKEHTFRAINSL